MGSRFRYSRARRPMTVLLLLTSAVFARFIYTLIPGHPVDVKRDRWAYWCPRCHFVTEPHAGDPSLRKFCQGTEAGRPHAECERVAVQVLVCGECGAELVFSVTRGAPRTIEFKHHKGTHVDQRDRTASKISGSGNSRFLHGNG
jgi:hypothetical protein